MDGGEAAIPCPEFGERLAKHGDGGNGHLPPILPHWSGSRRPMYDLTMCRVRIVGPVLCQNMNDMHLSNHRQCCDTQTVVNEAKEHYREWKFLYTDNVRQVGGTSMPNYEKAIGKQQLLETSLANLLISAECDYFIGTLGSNWNRLINELRLTNGRLRAGYVTLNFDEY